MTPVTSDHVTTAAKRTEKTHADFLVAGPGHRSHSPEKIINHTGRKFTGLLLELKNECEHDIHSKISATAQRMSICRDVLCCKLMMTQRDAEGSCNKVVTKHRHVNMTAMANLL